MAERQDSHPEAEKKSSGGQALVQIGHYVLGETLGIGTFGKVKGRTRFCCTFGCRIKTVSSRKAALQGSALWDFF